MGVVSLVVNSPNFTLDNLNKEIPTPTHHIPQYIKFRCYMTWLYEIKLHEALV